MNTHSGIQRATSDVRVLVAFSPLTPALSPLRGEGEDGARRKREEIHLAGRHRQLVPLLLDRGEGQGEESKSADSVFVIP